MAAAMTDARTLSGLGEARQGTHSRQGSHSRPPSSKAHARKEKVAMKVVLDKAGLLQYYPLFERAGFQMLECNVNFTDIQVEQILTDVERQHGRRFPADIRAKLWKVIRYLWFRNVATESLFLDCTEVPKLFLPKRDYKQIDWMVKFSDLDPDRQRQIVRKNKAVMTPQGKTVEPLQFEVYKRLPDLWYEFKDVQRSVTEWTRMNARMMLREDPREEVLKLRIRAVIDRASLALADRHVVNVTQRQIMAILLGIRIISAVLAVLMFVTAYVRFRNSPVEIVIHFMFGCRQFIAGVAYVMVFAVAWVVANRRRDDPVMYRLRRLIISSERLVEQISDFRVESEELRMSNQEAPKPAEVPPLGAPKPQQAKKPRELKRRKKKKQKDPMLQLWAPELLRNKDNMESVTRSLPAAHRALEPLPDNFRRQGGDRMWRFMDRLGNRMANVDEDQLVHRVIGTGEALPALPNVELPELPTSARPQLQLISELPELPDLPSLPVSSRPPSRSPLSTVRVLDEAAAAASGSAAASPRDGRPHYFSEGAVLAKEGQHSVPHSSSLYPWVPGGFEDGGSGRPQSHSSSGHNRSTRLPVPGDRPQSASFLERDRDRHSRGRSRSPMGLHRSPSLQLPAGAQRSPLASPGGSSHQLQLPEGAQRPDSPPE